MSVCSTDSGANRGSGKKRKYAESVEIGEKERAEIVAIIEENPDLSKILRTLLENKDPSRIPKTRAATEYEHVHGVMDDLEMEIDFQENHDGYMFELKSELCDETKTLSADIAPAVKLMLTTSYLTKRNAESHARTIIDLMLIDRLRHLQDQFSVRKSVVTPEVTLTARAETEDGTTLCINGRSDWTIGYGSDPSEMSDTVLIAVEAKGSGSGYIGMPQLIIYMTAAHQARSKKENKTVYGVLSDGVSWWFAILTNEGKLYTTFRSFWVRTEENLVVNYLDQILLHAIHSSAHTSPVKQGNTIIRRYNQFLRKTWHLGLLPGDGSEEEEEEEEDYDKEAYVDIALRGKTVIVKETRTL